MAFGVRKRKSPHRVKGTVLKTNYTPSHVDNNNYIRGDEYHVTVKVPTKKPRKTRFNTLVKYRVETFKVSERDYEAFTAGRHVEVTPQGRLNIIL
jgi:hypothetical protein